MSRVEGLACSLRLARSHRLGYLDGIAPDSDSPPPHPSAYGAKKGARRFRVDGRGVRETASANCIEELGSSNVSKRRVMIEVGPRMGIVPGYLCFVPPSTENLRWSGYLFTLSNLAAINLVRMGPIRI
jgi:hypothetical protein